jgi:hypothetical protein
MTDLVERVIALLPQPSSLALSPAEHDAVLEIAYLAIAADRRLHAEEIHGLTRVAEHLSGGPLAHGALDAMLARFGQQLDGTTCADRVRVVGEALKRPEPRAVAYKAAYGLSLCDLDTSDEEFEFDLDLIDALELSNEDAQRFADEVNDAFSAE